MLQATQPLQGDVGFASHLWEARARKSVCAVGASQENGHLVGIAVTAAKADSPVVCSVSGLSVVVLCPLICWDLS